MFKISQIIGFSIQLSTVVTCDYVGVKPVKKLSNYVEFLIGNIKTFKQRMFYSRTNLFQKQHDQTNH